jgi:hypothetical protein
VRNSSAGAAYRATLWKPPRTSFAGVPLNRGDSRSAASECRLPICGNRMRRSERSAAWIIKAEAKLVVSGKLGDAAEQMANNPVAVELRRMEMVTEVGAIAGLMQIRAVAP